MKTKTSTPWYLETIRAVALHLESEKRLSILCAGDELRLWSSLDDQRRCTVCKKTFSGRQVEIRRLTNGKYELRCPTKGCNSSPKQWEYPETPRVSDTVDPDWWRPSKRTGRCVAEQVEKVNPDLVKPDRYGKLQTVRYDAVNATFLSAFLKERRKVEEREATITKLQKQIEALTAGLQKVSAQLEMSKPALQPSPIINKAAGKSTRISHRAVTLHRAAAFCLAGK